MTPQNINHLIDAIAVIAITLSFVAVVAYIIITDIKNEPRP